MSQAEPTVLAREIMTAPAITIGPGATVADAAKLMLKHNIGCLPVVDDRGRMAGLLTESALFPQERGLPFSGERVAWLLGEWVGSLNHLESVVQEARGRPVTDVMLQREPISEEAPLAEIADTLLRTDVHHLVVEKDGRALGIVARHDLIKIFANH